MDNDKATRIDYSQVTPATDMNASDRPIASTLANAMPRNDMPASERSIRSDPDKTIPGPEAASPVDEVEEEDTLAGRPGTKIGKPSSCR